MLFCKQHGKRVRFLSSFFYFFLLWQFIDYFIFLERERDPEYAQQSRRGVYDETADRKIREAVIDNKLNFVHNYDHLCFYSCFIFMRYFGIRGYSEVCSLYWSQISFLVYKSGPFKGRNYIELKIDDDKGKYYF